MNLYYKDIYKYSGDSVLQKFRKRWLQYGHIVNNELKIPPHPPSYCFVEFENARYAEDAIRGRDCYSIDGYHIRVELAHSGRGQSSALDRHGCYMDFFFPFFFFGFEYMQWL